MSDDSLPSKFNPTVNSNSNSRRNFLRAGVTATFATAAYPALGAARVADTGPAPGPGVQDLEQNFKTDFELDEITIDDLQKAFQSGQYSSRSLSEKYLARIAEIDKAGPRVNAVIELNPDALQIADALDQERRSKGPRGPLHGIPVLIKDNIDTSDRMNTTAGSLALLGSRGAPNDAFVAAQLRKAGAVILGKTNLSEWANIRSSHSTSGWSGRGGLTRNPYALDRNPCGSSSGTGAAVSANLCVAGVGTETDGSVVCPASANGLAGLKPTVGLVSRSGIVPISHSQDTAGPMARTVRDVAILLGVMAGADPQDPVTADSQGKVSPDYTKFLDPAGLKGARLGVVRKYCGFNDAVDQLMDTIIREMKRAGAEIVDPADIPTIGKFDESELTVFYYELKADLAAYLARRGNTSVKSLKDVIEFNERNRDREMPYFGQDIFLKSEQKGPLNTKEYLDALALNQKLSRAEGIDFIMDKFKLDALVAPTAGPAWLTDLINGDHAAGGSSSAAAVAGYPNINVTAGYLWGLPVGISFFGRAWSEPTLLKIAYSFEQLTKARQKPRFLPTIEIPASR
jgi:amidase